MPTLSISAGQAKDVAGVHRRFIAQYTGPASYVTGGDPIAASDVGLGVLQLIKIANATDGTNFRTIAYSYATGKAIWFVGTTGVEVAAAQDLSTYVTRFEAVGR